MLRFLCPTPSPAGLLTSKLYDEKGFYEAFVRDLKHTKQEVIIESPYMTTPRVDMLKPTLKRLVKCGVKVMINTRYPGHHDKLLEIQSWLAAKSLREIGVKVKFLNDYPHRKIAVFDNKILWEGSLNILSQAHSREIMRRIESEVLTKQAIHFLRLKRFYW